MVAVSCAASGAAIRAAAMTAPKAVRLRMAAGLARLCRSG
jgi:hypothetical protein